MCTLQLCPPASLCPALPGPACPKPCLKTKPPTSTNNASPPLPLDPRRLIIPGYIGGRMIKWLEEITVTEVESQNYYHFHDNRVLPSHMDEALANKEGE